MQMVGQLLTTFDKISLLDRDLQNTLYNTVGKSEQKVINILDSTVTGDNFFNGVSRLITKITGDTDLGMHHLRHTFASAYTFKTLGNTIDLSLLNEDLPWLEDWLPSDEQLTEFLGSEGQCGQGVKAISASLGHIHETTTLRHYIHILFASLHSYHLAQKQPDLHIAFEKREISRSGLHGYKNKLSKEKNNLPKAHISRAVRNNIEKYLQKKAAIPLIIHSKINAKKKPGIIISESAEQLLSQFENIEKYILFTIGVEPDNIEKWVDGLKNLAKIESGKKGSDKPRHPLPLSGKDCNLPKPLNVRIAHQHALKLLSWLSQLQYNKSDDFQWLINKWLHHSEAEKGFMRLDSEEKQKVENLSKEAIDYEVSMPVSKKGKSDYFRIRILGEDSNRTNREAGAVRWVMSWMAVKQTLN
jgi:hypothetical protein